MNQIQKIALTCAGGSAATFALLAPALWTAELAFDVSNQTAFMVRQGAAVCFTTSALSLFVANHELEEADWAGVALVLLLAPVFYVIGIYIHFAMLVVIGLAGVAALQLVLPWAVASAVLVVCITIKNHFYPPKPRPFVVSRVADFDF